jgi:acetyl/propionyl-CoA carboxylase alpha subunit
MFFMRRFRALIKKEMIHRLCASGTIEAVEVNVSSEISGKVKDVLVDEGQSVKDISSVLKMRATTGAWESELPTVEGPC